MNRVHPRDHVIPDRCNYTAELCSRLLRIGPSRETSGYNAGYALSGGMCSLAASELTHHRSTVRFSTSSSNTVQLRCVREPISKSFF
jgi:hypothetical protein